MAQWVRGTSRTMTRMCSDWVSTVRSDGLVHFADHGADLIGGPAFGEGDFDERHCQLLSTNGSATGPSSVLIQTLLSRVYSRMRLGAVLDADAAVLETLPRRHRGHRPVGVDPDRAGLESPGHPMRASRGSTVQTPAARPYSVSLASADDLVLGVERHDRRDRAEDLLRDHPHVVVDVDQDGRLVEVAAQAAVGGAAAGQDPGALGAAEVDVGGDLVALVGEGQRAQLGRRRRAGRRCGCCGRARRRVSSSSS